MCPGGPNSGSEEGSLVRLYGSSDGKTEPSTHEGKGKKQGKFRICKKVLRVSRH